MVQIKRKTRHMNQRMTAREFLHNFQAKKALGVLLLVLFGYILAGANDRQVEFQKGNQYYGKEDFDKAIAAYESVLQKDFTSKELYYNLANAYFKKQGLGKAILNYEKALLLAPRDADVLHNLEIAKARRLDEISTLPPFFLFSWWQGLRDSLSPTAWVILCLLALWLAAGGLAGWLFFTIRQKKKWSFLGGLASFAFMLLFLALAFSRLSYVKDSGQAILIEKEKELHSGPDTDSPAILKLHEGTKVEILDQIGDWQKIRLVNGEQGWLPVVALGKI